MSMNDLLIECQNKVAQLEAERDKLAAALYEANNKLDDVRDSFCGKNLMISGWHLNGDLEPVDNWFDSNDWEPVHESSATTARNALNELGHKEKIKVLRDALNNLLNDCINFDNGNLSDCHLVHAARILKETNKESI